MNIQRYDIDGWEWTQDPHPEGDFVLYADHVAALAEVTGRSDEAIYNDGYLARLQEEYVLDGGDPYREAYRKGYTAGYNEAMRLHQNLDVADWMYGHNQHGKGENP